MGRAITPWGPEAGDLGSDAIAEWQEPFQLGYESKGVRLIDPSNQETRMTRTFLEVFELDRSCQWPVGTVACDIGSERSAGLESHRQIFVGDIRRKTRYV